MAKPKLADKLFRYMWHRFVAGKSDQQAAELSGVDPTAFEEHRARRTPQYVQAERRLADAMPRESFVVFARAAQLRALTVGSDSTAASVAAKILEAAADDKDQPAAITFIVAPVDDGADAEALPDGATVMRIEQVKRMAAKSSSQMPQPAVVAPQVAGDSFAGAAAAAYAAAKSLQPQRKKAADIRQGRKPPQDETDAQKPDRNPPADQ